MTQHDSRARQDVARPVWSVATHKGELTARRLVITFVASFQLGHAPGRVSAVAGALRILREVLIAAIAYSSHMTENRRDLSTIDGIVEQRKVVAP
jgi:hypothetical protein